MKVKEDEINKALAILDKATGGDATEWYNYRSQKGYTRIIDQNSGKWVSQFEGASGEKYFIRSPINGIGPKRYTELMKRYPAIGFDSTFEALFQNLEAATNAANTIGSREPKLSDLFAALSNMGEGIRRNDRQWQASLMICTLFIVTENEDLTTWNIDDARQKVEDWNKAKIHEQDFFFLVSFWRALSAKWFEALPERINQLKYEYNPFL